MKNFVRERRRQLGYTQKELSLLSGVPQSSISSIESGRKPYVDVAILLAWALDAPVDELFIVT